MFCRFHLLQTPSRRSLALAQLAQQLAGGLTVVDGVICGAPGFARFAVARGRPIGSGHFAARWSPWQSGSRQKVEQKYRRAVCSILEYCCSAP
jgi:hypothetical protein